MDEGANLNFVVTATNPDLTTPSLTADGVPTNASFVDNANGTGTFNFDPNFTQSGMYDVTIIASNGLLADSEVVTITVNETNRPPVLAQIPLQFITERVNLSIQISASDPDGAVPTLSASSLPTGASFVDNGNATGSFSWTPSCGQAGNHAVMFYASDGTDTDSQIVSITVFGGGSLPPVLAAIGPQSTDENLLLTFGISATLANCSTPVLIATGMPTGATFTDLGDGNATFSWTPGFTQAGVYDVTFHAFDGLYKDSEVVAITVDNVIQPDSTDSVQVGSTIALQGEQVMVPVLFENSQPLKSLTVPLKYTGDQVTADSISFAGSRVEGLEVLTASINTVDQTIRIHVVPNDAMPIPTGSGLLATIYFSIAASAPIQMVVIDTTTLAGPPDSLVFVDASMMEYVPGFREGVITVDATTSVGDDPVRPHAFTLSQNYPNPFNPSTSMTYSLDVAAVTRLDIYNVLGRHIVTLVDRHQSAGNHTVTWNGTDVRGRFVPSGIYMVRLTSSHQTALMKMTLMK